MAQTNYEKTGSVGEYDQAVAYMRELHSEGSSVPWELICVGKSYAGKPIWAALIGCPPLTADTMIHMLFSTHPGELSAREGGLQYLRQLVQTTDQSVIDYFATVGMVLIPSPQPDNSGAGGNKFNLQGINLNRDYHTMVAPESRSMASVLWRFPKIALSVDAHEGGTETTGSLSRGTLSYGIAPEVSASGDALIAHLQAKATAEGLTYPSWNPSEPGMWHNAAGVQGVPAVLVETSPLNGATLPIRIERVKLMFEWARQFHAANKTDYANISATARSAVNTPLFIQAAANK